jgi:hypothetical protein
MGHKLNHATACHCVHSVTINFSNCSVHFGESVSRFRTSCCDHGPVEARSVGNQRKRVQRFFERVLTRVLENTTVNGLSRTATVVFPYLPVLIDYYFHHPT